MARVDVLSIIHEPGGIIDRTRGLRLPKYCRSFGVNCRPCICCKNGNENDARTMHFPGFFFLSRRFPNHSTRPERMGPVIINSRPIPTDKVASQPTCSRKQWSPCLGCSGESTPDTTGRDTDSFRVVKITRSRQRRNRSKSYNVQLEFSRKRLKRFSTVVIQRRHVRIDRIYIGRFNSYGIHRYVCTTRTVPSVCRRTVTSLR